MDFTCVRGCLGALALLLACNHHSAADPPQPAPAKKPAADFSDPRATYRTYLDAVLRNDLEAAKQCWMIDDDDKFGALDTLVGLWVVPRRFFQIAAKTYKAEDLPADFQKRQREDLTDAAIELTRKRLGDADVKLRGDTAELKMKWQKDDGYPTPAFEYSDDPKSFRRVAGNWKLDFNEMTGVKRSADFFKNGAWGTAFRDQVAILRQACDGMEKGQLKTVPELEAFLKNQFDLARKKHEERAAALQRK